MHHRIMNERFMHRGHMLAHSFYLTAAAMEGHLFYSTMAAVTLIFMLGTALVGGGSE